MQEFFICYPPLNSSTLYFSDLYICFWFFFHYTKSFLRAGILSFSLQYALGHRESSIYEGLKWALESITMNKASGCDGIPVELFQILKDDAVKVLHSICHLIWKTQQWPQDWKRSVVIPIPKNVQTTSQLHLSHMLEKQSSNSPTEASTACELRTSRCSSWI